MVRAGHVDHVLLYTWDAAPEFLTLADEAGVSGVALKSHEGAELVEVIERVASGERIGLDNAHRGRHARAPDTLSTREQEVLALIALGMSNAEIGQGAVPVGRHREDLRSPLVRQARCQESSSGCTARCRPQRHASRSAQARGKYADRRHEPRTVHRISSCSTVSTTGTTSTLRSARNDVVELLETHVSDQDLQDRAELVVSELATNAIQASPGIAYGVRVSLADDGSVVMAVTSYDPARRPPPRVGMGARPSAGSPRQGSVDRRRA